MENGKIKSKDNNDPNYEDAGVAASIDMEQDPDLDPTPDVADDLDEGELARFDNDGEKNYTTNENSDAFKTAVENASQSKND